MLCHNCDHEIEYAAVCPYCGTRMLREPLPHHLPTGTVIDNRYKIMGVLGEGGFGITYLGYNQKLGMPVAIKEYFPQGTTYRDTSGNHEVYVSSESAEAFFNHGKERFLSEAKTLVRFNAEPGIVSVMDFVEENQTAYLIMEYLDGETLQQYLKRHGKMAATETFEMLEPMMRTLEKVHAAGVIHRDISPDNIMRLKNGQLKLMDFGAAREFVDENRSMSIMLKKGYAPAEQYRRNGEQGPWTDVYALCATIYRCITGVTPTDSLDRMSGEELKRPSELGADIPPAYEGLLMYGMALHQKDRCQSMDELIGLSEQATHNESAPKIAKPERATPPKKHSAKESNATVLVASKQADPYATVYAEKTNADEFAPVNTEQKPEPEPKKKRRKKKGLLIAAISLLLVIAVVVTGFVIWQNQNGTTTAEKSNFEYKDIGKNTVEITNYSGSSSDITIPSNLDGYKVTSIGFQAFTGCTGLTSVTIPDSVTSIGNYAFYDCTGLTSVTIPASVTSIGWGAFSDCKGLTSITIPDSVTSIGGSAFSGCTGLTSITIPDSVKSIDDGAFYGCTGLTSITIPDSVKSIGTEAFEYCTGLTSVTTPDSVTSIGTEAFECCTGLTSITIPDSVTSIGWGAFDYCDNLTIYGSKGSVAEKYANDNGIEFREI